MLKKSSFVFNFAHSMNLRFIHALTALTLYFCELCCVVSSETQPVGIDDLNPLVVTPEGGFSQPLVTSAWAISYSETNSRKLFFTSTTIGLLLSSPASPPHRKSTAVSRVSPAGPAFAHYRRSRPVGRIGRGGRGPERSPRAPPAGPPEF